MHVDKATEQAVKPQIQALILTVSSIAITIYQAGSTESIL